MINCVSFIYDTFGIIFPSHQLVKLIYRELCDEKIVEVLKGKNESKRIDQQEYLKTDISMFYYLKISTVLEQMLIFSKTCLHCVLPCTHH